MCKLSVFDMPALDSTMASQELEHFYAAVHGEEGHLPSFPPSYPQSALLGAVEIIDCVEVRQGEVCSLTEIVLARLPIRKLIVGPAWT